LTLGGKADEEFETGPIGLIDAFRKVRGKLTVLCQIKRIVVPRKHHSILLLLDGIVRQVVADERKNSWRSKFAIIRYENSEGSSWRLWIGSRNLTGSRDVEAGLLLTGKVSSGRGVVLDDVTDLINRLPRADDLPRNIQSELRQVRWSGPAGVRVTKIHWRRVGTVVPFLEQNVRPRSTIAISPFIDKWRSRCTGVCRRIYWPSYDRRIGWWIRVPP